MALTENNLSRDSTAVKVALKSTVYKTELQVSNMDEQHYETYSLTLARHPSETNQRMMLRLAVFALNANQQLSFTKGISTDDEPDLWLKSLSDEIELWIELGQPDEKRLRRACGRSKRVLVYPYAERSASIWWEQMRQTVSRFANLSVINLILEDMDQLDNLVARNMQLHSTIQEGQLWLGNDQMTLLIELQQWQ
ncbi:MAG: YaeQ family protein [Candidatus Thiodiazotropha lotti]|nr:YaeQ family protein [Candidatus Thiodiazotropha lotti]MCW4199390.1 YaeQ family protein [Candidatus Thiodiazotropha lotti]